jgi:hypothetical protein
MSSGSPAIATSIARFSKPALDPKAEYTVGAETPARSATSVIAVGTNPRSTKSSCAACTIRCWLCAAAARRRDESYCRDG